MNTLTFLKRLAAFGLLIAFFLPLSQCSLQEKNTSEKSLTQTVQAAKMAQNDGIIYANRADKDGTLFTLANGFAFFWPSLFVLLTFSNSRIEQNLAVRLCEILLCLGSAVILLRLTSFGTLLVGAYLAWSSLGIYSTITLFNFIVRIRRTWQMTA